MPSTTESVESTKKRKREPAPAETNGPSEVLHLENQILESRRHYNNIVTLLNHCWSQKIQAENEESTIAVVALCRVFCRLMALGNLSKPHRAPEKEITIVRWLNARYSDYKDILLSGLSQGDESKQKIGLNLLMRLVKEEAAHLKLSEEAIWRTGTFAEILKALTASVSSEGVRDEYVRKYVEVYDDVRFYTFARLGALASTELSGRSLGNIILMLAAIETTPKSQGDLKDFFLQAPSTLKHELYSLSAHKKQAQGTWLAILRNDLNRQQRKRVLGMMSHQIVPWFLKVELLMDFLTDSFNEGGSTSLMALSGLFHLIQRKNLDYPQFYEKVYSLLDYNVLHSKHRSPFFRLLETFLSSTHLPAALVASFIKRLSRLSLNAPPTAIVVVVPLIYNLLKAHPMCTFMIHRAAQPPQMLDKEDRFQMDEADPMKTHAIDSSLWEIHTLQDHYHPNVATIARIISQPFTKQGYTVEDFLDHSYESMLNTELSKDMKKAPEIEYAIPKRIFNGHGPDSGQEHFIIAKLFSFE